MLDKQVVGAVNWLTRTRKVRVRPDELLLLFPHCMQWQRCPHNIIYNLENCKHCGQCQIGALIELAEKYGVRRFCASGGRQAAKQCLDPHVKAILAVACEKELHEGMQAIFPKPTVGVINLRPKGPCTETEVLLESVESALRELLAEPPESDAAGASASPELNQTPE